MKARFVACLLLAAAPPLAAQHLTIGSQVALVDYREQGPSLAFQGWGVGGTLGATYRRFTLLADVLHGRLDPAARDSIPPQPFDLTQIDVRLRIRAVRMVGVEAGYLARLIAPDGAAQQVGALRAGVYAIYPLAPVADISVQASYLGAAHFSGGGRAPFGIALGLGARYALRSGTIAITSDYELERFDRTTTVASAHRNVPVQSAVTRLGVAIRP